MTVFLKKMSEEFFLPYMERMIKEYAKEKVVAGTWLEEESEKRATQEINNLLPEGLHTKNHFLLEITTEDSGKGIGSLWVRFDPENMQKEAFIYDFFIQPEERDKGYGKATLFALEDYVRLLGAKKLSLHVFGHNERAIHLYKKVKFQVTDLVMSKML
ncbi:MAG TPA: GNAT family N-acetyltransferase [Niallia sp.]|nr:GNAT family N-acetyltransferase [Niallia sp.]